MSKADRPGSTAAIAGKSSRSFLDGLCGAILERIPEGVFVTDRRGVLIAANSSLCRALGYGRDELPGKRSSDLILPRAADGGALFDKNRRLVVGEKFRCTMLQKNNSHAAVTLSTVRIASGETVGIVHSSPGRDPADLTSFRLAAIVANSNDAIIGKDLNGIVTEWNAAAEVIFGYTADEMIGQSIRKIVPPDRVHEEDDILERIGKGQTVGHFETLRQTKDQKLIDVSVTISPIRNSLGEIIGASKVARDITKAKAREAEIARRSRLYDALSQINQSIVYTKRQGELFSEVCQVLVERGGFQAAWIGFIEPRSGALAPVAMYGNGIDHDKLMKALMSDRRDGHGPTGIAFQTGRPCICEDLSDDAVTNTWRDLVEAAGCRSSAVFPIREQGVIKGTLNVCAVQPGLFNYEEICLLKEAAGDVSFALDNLSRETERRNAERVARQETGFSNTIIESVPGIFCVMGLDGKFLRWNRNLESMSGFPSGDIGHMRPAELFAIDGEMSPEPAVPAALQAGDSPIEVELKTGSGERIPCIFTTTKVDYKGSRCLVCMGFDISKLKQAESALLKLNESLEQQVAARTRELRETLDHAIAADGVKSVFLATMSHELRTPLNSIIGFTGILLRGMTGELTSEQLKQLGMIQNSARHLLDLINDVLDISKIEAGQLEIHMDSFDLRDLLVRAVALVEPLAERKGLELAVDIDADIGAVFSDKRRIEQILINLLNNAIKFTERGTIRLSAQTMDDYRLRPDSAPVQAVRLCISDTGIGIRPADIDTLFQPFRQLDAGFSRQHEGTGLGLAICRRLADMLHGRIVVESKLGEGSTFSILLPVNSSVAS